jgi:hypothetical protein
VTKLSFTECPKGHKLPREGCTPLYCGDTPNGKKVVRKDPASLKAVKQGRTQAAHAKAKSPGLSGVALREVEKLKSALAVTDLGSAAPEVPTADEDHQAKVVERVGKRIAERAVRMALLKLPPNLSGADAEEWADRKAVELLPHALAQIEYDLLYGDDGQRREAARDVLDMTGRRRRDGGGNVAPTIVLNLGAGNMLPWERAGEKVTTGTATRVEAGANAAAGDGPAGPHQTDGGRGSPGS